MVHAVYTRNLGRSRSWHKATVRSLAQALLRHERIETTLAKAKEAQRFAERLVTLGKDGSLSARRKAASLLGNPELVRRLFSEVAPRFEKRLGGYTRILHGGYRSGDGASLALLEFVELSPRLKEDKKGKGERTPSEPKPPKKSLEPTERATPEMGKAEEFERPKGESGGFLGGLRKFFKDRPKQ